MSGPANKAYDDGLKEGRQEYHDELLEKLKNFRATYDSFDGGSSDVTDLIIHMIKTGEWL